ncbi:hypothetical protein HK104_005445 [Borealophlyctis nickersoniae]|nr:hypothetical protein HK104_005445 [Borealophlyctis nickersoniae]
MLPSRRLRSLNSNTIHLLCIQYRNAPLIYSRVSTPQSRPYSYYSSRLPNPDHPNYEAANHDWTHTAINFPLIHKQTGIRVHLVGVNHHSPASLARVHEVITTLKPRVICLELDEARRAGYEAKAEALLDQVLRGGGGSGGGKTDHGGGPSGVGSIVQGTSSSSSARMVSGRRAVAVQRTTDYDHRALMNLGIDPAAHVDSSHIHYGLEIGVALRAAKSCGAVVRNIDWHPNDLMKSKKGRDVTGELCRKYRLTRLRERRTGALASFLFGHTVKFAFMEGPETGKSLWSRFRWRRNIIQEMDYDATTVRDHALYLRVWSRFHRSTHFWWIELRNAGMVDAVKKCLRDVAEADGLLGGVGNQGESNQNGTSSGQSAARPPSIVVVVGKSHVFGMAEMWKDFVQNDAFELLQPDAIRKRLVEEVEKTPAEPPKRGRKPRGSVQATPLLPPSVSVRAAPPTAYKPPPQKPPPPPMPLFPEPPTPLTRPKPVFPIAPPTRTLSPPVVDRPPPPGVKTGFKDVD